MAKFWFGSLEQITEQYDQGGHLMPTALKPVKGWKAASGEYQTKAEKLAVRKKLSEQWWDEAEAWWQAQPGNLDLKGKPLDHPTTRELDYTPIRETNDFQLRITGPVDMPEKPPETNKPKQEVHTDKIDGKTLDRKGKTLGAL